MNGPEKVNVITFETATSDLLACSCGNLVTGTGFNELQTRLLREVRFVCAGCGAQALVDFKERAVVNITQRGRA
jgi:hypothetical protein